MDDIVILKHFCRKCKQIIEVLYNNKCSLCSSSFVELTTESLDQVRPAKALTIKSKRTSDKPTDCTICLNPMVDTRTNEDTFVALECGHKYHRECIEGWLDEHNTCPLCRVRVDVSSVNDKLRGQPRDRDLLSLDYMERIMVQFEQIRSMILDMGPREVPSRALFRRVRVVRDITSEPNSMPRTRGQAVRARRTLRPFNGHHR